MAEHNTLGKEGEDEASAYLVRQGYEILHRNWRSGKKELDIVAIKDEELTVVEVKTRRNTEFAQAYDAVNEQKIKRIVLATNTYLKKFQLDMPVHFDIITLVGNTGSFTIEHIKEAFYPPVWSY